MRLLTLTLLLFGTASVPTPLRAADATPARAPYKDGGYIYFEGRAFQNAAAMSKSQSRAMSKDAAIMDAMKKIALYIGRWETQGGKTLKQAMEKDEKIRIKVEAFIKGAETIKANWEGNGECRVLLRIDRKNLTESLKTTEALPRTVR